MDYFLIALKLASQIMSNIPDYDQRKKEKFFNLSRQLEEEWNRPYPDRDDDLILNLRDELGLFIKSFYEEIKK